MTIVRKGSVFVFEMTDTIFAALNHHRIFTQGTQTKRRIKNGHWVTADMNTVIEPYASFLAGWKLCTMGAFSFSLPPVIPSLRIGRYCSIAIGAGVLGIQHPLDRISTSNFTYTSNPVQLQTALADAQIEPFHVANPTWFSPPVIGNDVWIGQDAVIGHGVTLGNGSVVGARSLVTHDVPPYAIVVGTPARVMRMRFPAAVIERLERVKWWRFAMPQLAGIALDLPIEAYLDALEERIADGLEPFTPEPPSLIDLVTEADEVGKARKA